MSEDAELLRRYAAEQSEAAFAELIRRHVDLVYSAALRLVNGDAHRAQDVTQQVFAEFARQAKRLARHPALAGWLYTTTRRCALRHIRTEQRRSVREQEATAMNELRRESTPEPDWDRVRPVLEDAMHELGEKDRHAVLLRFFQNKSLKEVGLVLGLGENAARMRVDRALEKLRDVLTRRGIATSASLASVISVHAVQVAPAGLVTTLTATLIATTGTATFTLLKFMNATTLKLTIGLLAVAGAATAVVVQHQSREELLATNQSLTQQTAQLRADNEDLSNRLAAAATTQSMPDSQLQELLLLRGEVGLLRSQTNQLARLWDENQRLQARLQAATSHRPAAIPESDPVEQHCVDAVNAAKQIGLAMRIYQGDHNDQFATNVDQIHDDLGGVTNFLGGVSLYDFELVNIGGLRFDYPQMVMFREKKPVQATNGRWYRVYGFVDGSVQRATSDDGNFDAWEKQNTYMPPQGQ